MKSLTIQEKLQSNKASIGTWMQIPSPDVAEILSKSNFDWIAIDLEHGVFNYETLLSCVRSIELGQALPFVRIGEHSEKIIKTSLEAGAKGIIIPMITSAVQLEKLISYCYYPPKGKRGVGFSRASLFGANFQDYFLKHNEQLTIVAQIESLEAVNNLQEIVKVPGLNAILVGPYDLSASIGKPGDFASKDFTDLMTKIGDIVKNSTVRMGMHVVDPVQSKLTQAIDEGNCFIAYGIDALFLQKSAKVTLGKNNG